jgi:signal peptidase I
VDRDHHLAAVRTTTLVQAFVIPTGSMEDTLLMGDHLLVDKLAYAPAGRFPNICCLTSR